MHAIHRTAPMPRPCVGVRVAGEAATPSGPLRSFRPLEPSESSGPIQHSEPLEPFDWAVEEPAWSDDAGPAATAPDWWLRDRPILATPPTTTTATNAAAATTTAANAAATRTTGPDATAESVLATRVAGLDAASEAVMAARPVGGDGLAQGTAAGANAAARSVGHVAGPPAGDRGVRLTRRGRLVVVGLAAALLLGAFWVGTRAMSAASTAAGTEVAYVQNGDTLWAVAERARPGVDPRDTVAGIRDLNGLKSTLVQPGQRLILPAR